MHITSTREGKLQSPSSTATIVNQIINDFHVANEIYYKKIKKQQHPGKKYADGFRQNKVCTILMLMHLLVEQGLKERLVWCAKLIRRAS